MGPGKCIKLRRKAIFQFWHDGNPPVEIAKRMKAWREFNPGWRYELYDRDSAACFMRQVYSASLSEAFLDIKIPAMMADVFRVARAFSGGGLYVDAATVCKAPLKSWLPRKSGLVLLAKPHMDSACQCCNGFIYARKPGHPFLKSLWGSISLLLLARQGSGVWAEFGPGLYWSKLEGDFLRASVQIMPSADLVDKLQLSSSSRILPKHQHWSKLQGSLESLYATDAHRLSTSLVILRARAILASRRLAARLTFV